MTGITGKKKVKGGANKNTISFIENGDILKPRLNSMTSREDG